MMFITRKNLLSSLLLLYIGYFIDFYDLTVSASGYSKFIPDLFHITDPARIQILHLQISSFYTLGIFCGSVFFGFLGDKIGRAKVIKFTILLYSLSTLASIFVHSIWLFTLLRFFAGAGLASEFAISSVLIAEIYPKNKSSLYTALLYCSGILGGLLAVFISGIAWKLTFVFGGTVGLSLFFIRRALVESPMFINYHQKSQARKFLNTSALYTRIIQKILKFSYIKYLCLLLVILPYSVMTSIMFTLPTYMHVDYKLSDAISTLLIMFFLGNLISSILCTYLTKLFKSYKSYLLINIIAFTILLTSFRLVNTDFFILYYLGLGLLGGGLPVVWIQLVTKSYKTQYRSTASNTLFAMSRLLIIPINLITAYSIKYNIFISYVIITTLIVGLLSLIAILTIKNNFSQKIT